MKVFNLASLLLALYTNGVFIHYDFTDPLNEIRAGILSVREFSTNIKSHFGNLTTSLELDGAYSPDCNILADCGSTMNDAFHILHDVHSKLLTQKVKIEEWIFQFRIEVSALKNLTNNINPTKLNIPAGEHSASFCLPEETTCDDLETVTTEQWKILLDPSTWFSTSSSYTVYSGIGYSEDLIGCQRLYDAIRASGWLQTFLSPGKTPGVVESFGIFKKRMDELHARNIEFVKSDLDYDYDDRNFVYSLTPQCLRDGYHRHLSENYWQRFLKEKLFAISPMPFGRFDIPSYSGKKIIPYIDAESCNGRNSIPWLAPAALQTLSRYFGAVVLTHAEWKTLMSNDSRSAVSGTPDIQLDIFIDYSDWLQYTLENPNFGGCDYNWSQIEDELNELDKSVLHPIQKISVTTLIFPLRLSLTAKNLTGNVNSGFAQRMSSRVVIGCGFLGELNYSTAASAVVSACKQVNGSLYTLQYHFKLKSIIKVSKENSQHFENVVRPKLDEMRKFRAEILVLHPQATVYFQLRFELQIVDNQATAFCNKETLSLNEYIEATVKWAEFNGIPLIMGRAFDDIDHQNYQTWFSVPRPTLNDFNTHFVIRNSPQIIADVEVEPCLEWTVHRPTVTESYFYNNHLGSLFPRIKLRQGKPITREEYEILLQLIFHRFDLVTVEVASDTCKDIITAINTLASDGLIGSTKTFFISYYDLRTDVDGDEKLRDFYGFLNFTKLRLGSNISLLKGIIFEDTALDSKNEIQNQTLRTRRKMLAVDRTRSLSLDVGIFIDCEDIIVDATSRKHIPKEVDNLLHKAKYLFCYKIVNSKNCCQPERLGMLFDTHFYTKKVYQEFYSHLDVYFETFVDIELTETTMTDYLILLSRFQKFASAYNLSYIILYAFDAEDAGYIEHGWWKISNYSNLSLTSIYKEKYSASVGSKTWVPSLNLKPNQETKTANDNKLYIILGVTTSGFVITIVVLVLVLWYYYNKKPQYLSNEEEKEFYNGKEGNGEEQISGDSEYRKFDKKFELAFVDLFIDPKDLLGRGNFGTVYKGLVKDEPVAIKRPNDNCSATSFKSVLSEVKLLCYISTHPNVIQFVGAYTKEIRKGILYIATELCSNGSLDGLLRAKKRVISNLGDAETIGTEDEDALHSHDLHRFAKEIASGMDYIAGKNVIHGDLAARNVLLDENFTCKIGDFGLSRKLYEYQEYVKQSQEPLPWKWMAYESLKNMQFTTKSDVWSYGVTIWEIYSLGSVPYGGLSWTAGFTDDLENGLRLQMPKYATEEIYKTMLSCWELDADERPTFTDLVDFFKQLTSSQYIVLEL